MHSLLGRVFCDALLVKERFVSPPGEGEGFVLLSWLGEAWLFPSLGRVFGFALLMRESLLRAMERLACSPG